MSAGARDSSGVPAVTDAREGATAFPTPARATARPDRGTARADRAAPTIGEAMIFALAQTIRDGELVFHGFASPMVQVAMHLAKRSHAPNMVLVAGATYGVNPQPPFLAPTSNDWVMDRRAECHLDIEELFDLAASGRVDRMFLSGVQIDRWGNTNVTRLGRDRLTVKLPGGGGGCNLSADVGAITLWTAAHRAVIGKDGRPRFRLVETCDFITNLGHRDAQGRTRAELGHRGRGPDALVTELGIFDFDHRGHVRLRALWPGIDLTEVEQNTGFPLAVADRVTIAPLPPPEAVDFIRRFDPLRTHERELHPQDRGRTLHTEG